MTEESPRKRARLCEDEVDSLCKPDLQEHIKKQEDYIAELEARLEMSAASTSNNGDGEDKVRHLKAARREQLLVMRLTTKEQELHELATQLADKTQNASTAQLRSATVDPALNLLIQRLKKELEDKTTTLQQALEDMAAWKFTHDSQTGKRLMARCRTLFQENQELGKQVSQGKVAQVEAELALQKEINEELKTSQDEMYEMVIQLNDEGEGMQSTILALQQELKDKQMELARLTYAAESAGIVLTPVSSADMKHDQHNQDNREQNMQPESPPNMQPGSPPNMQDNEVGKHVEPCKELVEHEEEKKEEEEEEMEGEMDEEEEAVEKQIPDVRTTEYIDDDETPMDVMSPHDPGLTENKSLSVEPWCNPSHFVESPASPVEEEHLRTAEEPIMGDGEFRTEAPSSKETCKLPNAVDDREIPQFQGGNSPETTDSDGQLLIEDYSTEQDQERTTDYRDVEKDEEPQVRTPLEDSSYQGSLPSEEAPEVDAVSSRTGEEGSGILTPDFSTNGDENHSEPILTIPQNNGKESDNGRLVGNNENCDDDDDVNELNTLVRDSSTFGAVNEGEIGSSLDDESDRQSDITDKQSDITDKQSDITDKPSDIQTVRQSEETTIDNNNGLSNPGDDGIDSNMSSPQSDHNCASDGGEVVRTDNVIINKSLNSNSYTSNSPDERTESAQCEETPAAAATNSTNPEEISV